MCFITSDGGIGKTTALKHLALSWAKGQVEMQKYDLVFYIALKYVKDHRPLTRIILDQHKGLAANNVSEHEISDLLDGKFQGKMLVLIDGFDEYHMGTNRYIDSVLQQCSLWNSWIILTSRPFDKANALRLYFDAEATIIGFNDASIKEYASKFFQNDEDGRALLEKAAENQILDILRIPLILQMMCVLFKSGDDVPQTKTEAVRAMVNWFIKYSEYRQSPIKPEQDNQSMLYNLGKLAWASLHIPDMQQILFDKVCIFYG